ncbi:MAG: hypothetical protein HC811_13225 [Flammeovirgaceae bacterium]|nr:hypothetical protein [Flammeovirgaceae bacterium]
MKKIAFAICIFTLVSGCKTETSTKSELGTISFEITGTEEAQSQFMQGLLLLHSFEYDDAREAFLEAQESDPSCAMAYWGEAMTYNHPLWTEQDFEKASAALENLEKTTKDVALRELEKDFIQGVTVLYGEGSKVDRDKAYAEYMKSLYEKYPGNHEVAAFYGLSLLGSVPVGRDDDVYQQSARIVEGILAENPRHPGALHYMIHANDDPYHAMQALEAADAYAVVAPSADHALHMPSHIYVAMGMWDQVVSSNEASYQASVARMERKNFNNDERSYHAFHWLLYGYLQQGQIDKAKTILNEMVQYHNELPSKSARRHLIYIKSTYLIETGDWDNILAEVTTKADDINIRDRAEQDFISGMILFRKGNPTELENLISNMNEDRETAALKISNEGIAMCSAGASRSDASRLDINQAEVMAMELHAMLAMLKNQNREAENWMIKATELETSSSYSYGPPSIVKPSYELYGEFLLSEGRADEAMAQFEISLKRAPKRVLALKGVLQAAQMKGDADKIKEVENMLNEIRKEGKSMSASMN